MPLALFAHDWIASDCPGGHAARQRAPESPVRSRQPTRVRRPTTPRSSGSNAVPLDARRPMRPTMRPVSWQSRALRRSAHLTYAWRAELRVAQAPTAACIRHPKPHIRHHSSAATCKRAARAQSNRKLPRGAVGRCAWTGGFTPAQRATPARSRRAVRAAIGHFAAVDIFKAHRMCGR